jgi:putative transposase
MYGKIGKEIGEILSMVCKITGIELIKGGVCPNHVHLYVSIPPKMSVSGAMSKLKGKSALMIFDRHPEYRDKYGRHFWARGYYAETIGQVNEETIKKYIEEQEECSRIEG